MIKMSEIYIFLFEELESLTFA